MIVQKLAIGEDDGAAGGKLLVEVVTVELVERLELIIGMNAVFKGSRENIKKVCSAGVNFQIFRVRPGLEFDVVVSLCVQVIDGGVVSGECFGN